MASRLSISKVQSNEKRDTGEYTSVTLFGLNDAAHELGHKQGN